MVLPQGRVPEFRFQEHEELTRQADLKINPAPLVFSSPVGRLGLDFDQRKVFPGKRGGRNAEATEESQKDWSVRLKDETKAGGDLVFFIRGLIDEMKDIVRPHGFRMIRLVGGESRCSVDGGRQAESLIHVLEVVLIPLPAEFHLDHVMCDRSWACPV